MVLPLNLEIAFLGISPSEMKIYFFVEASTQMFIAAGFVIAPNWKPLKYLSVGKRLNKLWYIHAMGQQQKRWTIETLYV